MLEFHVFVVADADDVIWTDIFFGDGYEPDELLEEAGTAAELAGCYPQTREGQQLTVHGPFFTNSENVVASS